MDSQATLLLEAPVSSQCASSSERSAGGRLMVSVWRMAHPSMNGRSPTHNSALTRPERAVRAQSIGVLHSNTALRPAVHSRLLRLFSSFPLALFASMCRAADSAFARNAGDTAFSSSPPPRSPVSMIAAKRRRRRKERPSSTGPVPDVPPLRLFAPSCGCEALALWVVSPVGLRPSPCSPWLRECKMHSFEEPAPPVLCGESPCP